MTLTLIHMRIISMRLFFSTKKVNFFFFFDKKANCDITVLSYGNGRYQVTANGDESGKERRVSAITGGLIKLGDMITVDEENSDQVAFPCGCSHDALVGLLLVRAPNVRAVAREQQMTASRGVLSSPSQQ